MYNIIINDTNNYKPNNSDQSINFINKFNRPPSL